MGKNSPSAKRYADIQYAEGTARGLEVGLRVAAQLQLTPELAVAFLTHLQVVCRRMRVILDTANPFLDRAVATTLQEMNSKQNCLL